MDTRKFFYPLFCVLQAFTTATAFMASHASIAAFDPVRVACEQVYDIVMYAFPFSLYLPLERKSGLLALAVSTALSVLSARLMASRAERAGSLAVKVCIYAIVSAMTYAATIYYLFNA